MYVDQDPASDEENDCESSRTIESIFSKYIDKICDALKEGSDFRKVRRKCVANVNVIGTISLSKEIQNEIRNTDNFDDLFDVLCCTPYWNWMNIRMLEKMAGDCSEAKHLIEKYKSTIFSRKVKDIISEIPCLKIPPGNYTRVKEKWKKDLNDLKIKDIVNRWNEIERKFNVEETMLLESITEGCVEICWLLPSHHSKHVICLATNNEQGRLDDDDQSGSGTQDLFLDMLYLKIGDNVIKDIMSKFKCSTKCSWLYSYIYFFHFSPKQSGNVLASRTHTHTHAHTRAHTHTHTHTHTSTEKQF